MNLVYGQVVEIFEDNGMKIGRVRIAGVFQKVPLDLLAKVACGDRVLICDGVAISKVEEDVSRDSRKTD